MNYKKTAIKNLFKQNPLWILFGTICVFVTSYSLALSANYIRHITDHIQHVGLNGLWFLIFMACITQVIHYITKFGLAVSCQQLSFRLCKYIRINLLECWLHIPFAEFERKQVGQYISIAQNDANNASFYVYVVFSRISMSVFNVLMPLPFMIQIDFGLTVIVLVVSLSFGAINQRILTKIKINESNARKSQEDITNTALNGFDSADSITNYNASTYMQNLYNKVRLRYSKALLSNAKIDGARNGFYVIVQNTTLYGSIIFLAYRTIIGSSTLGETLAFNILLTQALVAIEMIYRWSGSVVRCNASWERLEANFELNVVSKELCNYDASDADMVSINNLTFGYTNDKALFNNFSMKFDKGKIYRISGDSGSGKTTLIKCLLGLYRAENAQYILNDRESTQDEIARLVSFVPSEHYLFQGSIFDNLSLGNEKITKEGCLQMADTLGVGDWLRGLNGQLEYVIEAEGRNLSGGQRQSLCILRALLFKRPILILDEPFSALDSERESRLIKVLNGLKKNYMILITSHRTQTLDFCDGLIALD